MGLMQVKTFVKSNVSAGTYVRICNVYDKLRYAVFGFRYFGDEYECPFCDGQFNTFLPFSSSRYGTGDETSERFHIVGGGHYPNVHCPRCHSTNRERLLYLYLRNDTGLFEKNNKLLHMAPEMRLGRRLVQSFNLDYLSADLDSSRADAKIDLTDIQYGDGTFDTIVCSHVLEHILNDKKAMSEMFRVLKSGGWAILQVPVSMSLEETLEDPSVENPKDRERVFGQWDHVRIYARDDYVSRLKSVGFDVEISNFAKRMSKEKCHRFGINEEEEIFICYKPCDEPIGESPIQGHG